MARFFLLFLLFCFEVKAQNSFSFLNITNNARVNGLGGINVSLTDKDINLVLSNPALLDSAQSGQIGLNFSPYFAGSNFISLNYSPNFKHETAGNWAFSLQNINYGTFQGTDAAGNLTNDFSANDFSLGAFYSRKINNISCGVSAKLVGSVLESYSSVVILTDWGGTFKHPVHDLSIGVVAKNIGFVLKSYANIRPEIPFDLQAGVTFKPRYMPVRFSLTAHRLYQFDMAYNDPNFNFTFDAQGNKIPRKISTIDKVFRHFVVGTELILHRNFNLLVGYNFLRRKELLISDLGGASGFSFGANIRIKQFGFSTAITPAVTARSFATFSLIWQIKNK